MGVGAACGVPGHNAACFLRCLQSLMKNVQCASRPEGDAACTSCVASSQLPRTTTLGRRLCIAWFCGGGHYAVLGGGRGVHPEAIVTAFSCGLQFLVIAHFGKMEKCSALSVRVSRVRSHPAALTRNSACPFKVIQQIVELHIFGVQICKWRPLWA